MIVIKTVMKYIPFLLLSFVCLSCNDYLTRAPLDSPSDENFISNEAELEMAVTGVYNSLWFSPAGVSHNFKLSFISTSDIGWDRNEGDLTTLGKGNATSENSFTASFWNHFYQGIARSNFILSKAEPLKEEIDKAKYNRLIAETRFLRAYFYFYLSELFGDVPLIKEPVSLSEAEMPRVAKSEVIDFILSELNEIKQDLPIDSDDKARATRGVVLALQARVALYNERWEQAAQAANILIEQGSYQLHDNYQELFQYSGENSSEIIMSVQYMEGERTHVLPLHFWSRMSLGQSVKIPTQSLVDSYESIDGLSIDQSPLYDPEQPFKNRDPRLGYTVVLPNSLFMGYIYNTNPDSTQTWDYSSSPPERVENTEASHAYSSFSGYLWRKYTDPADQNDLYSSDLNIILFRYAEVLLNYAEAKTELNEIDQSVYDAVNAIRTRPSVDMPSIAGGKSQSEMRNIIWKERKYEFAGEGLRYFDIRRWKIAEDVIPGPLYGRYERGYLSDAPEINEIGTPSYDNVRNADQMIIIENRRFNPERDYLWPIPQIELQTNSELDQNPQY